MPIKTALCAALVLSGSLFAQTRFVQAELVNPIKIKKAKVGDAVKARTMLDATLPKGTTIPAGTTLIGHLRLVAPSALSITFDEMEVDDKKTPLSLSIRAAMMPEAAGHAGRASQTVAATSGAVIGLDGVTIEIDDSPAHATKFQATHGELKIEKGLQLMLAVPEAQ